MQGAPKQALPLYTWLGSWQHTVPQFPETLTSSVVSIFVLSSKHVERVTQKLICACIEFLSLHGMCISISVFLSLSLYIYMYISSYNWGSRARDLRKPHFTHSGPMPFSTVYEVRGRNWCIRKLIWSAWHPQNRCRMSGSSAETLKPYILMNYVHLWSMKVYIYIYIYVYIYSYIYILLCVYICIYIYIYIHICATAGAEIKLEPLNSCSLRAVRIQRSAFHGSFGIHVFIYNT